MTVRELEAAGIHDDALRASYRRCRDLLARHGRTYHLATRLLPPAKRPFISAVYGFARYADEIVDDLAGTTADQRADRLARWSDTFLADLDRGSSTDPVTAAVIDTAVRWRLPHKHFQDFLDAMRTDLTVSSYDSYDELMTYVYGSAAVIGLMTLPVLEPTTPDAEAYARDLGIAFQLANFVRDVGEDLDRGRVYLPLDELARFGVDREVLERRVVTPAVRAALESQVARVRVLAAAAAPGVAMLHPSSQPCVEASRVLYCGIVDAVEALDYQVFDRRATVSTARRAAVAGPAWTRALLARVRYGPGRVPPAAPR